MPIHKVCVVCKQGFSVCPYRANQRYCTRQCQIDEDTSERFWEKVQKGSPESCWEWQSCRLFSGHGFFQIKYKGKASRKLAHRQAWELTYGPIPTRKQINHKCDNPPCCNPHHLYCGTQAQNVQDMVDRGRNKALQGNQHPLAKLTGESVRQIRQLKGTISNRKIAKQFHVSSVLIGRILRNKIWNKTA